MSERKPHICFVALNAFPLLAGDASIEFSGGAELQQVELAKMLVKTGYKVTMICRDDGQADDLEIDGIRTLNAYKRYAGLPGLRFIHPRLTGLWRTLKHADADIYYTRTASILPGVVAAFCNRHGKKSIFAGAGNPDFDRKTRNVRFRRDRWIYEYGLRNTDLIVVQNEEQAALCKRNFARDAVLIPSIFTIIGDDLVQQRSYVLWVSTIRWIKRPQLFIELAGMLPDYKFRMIGGRDRNDAGLFDEIEEMAEKHPNVEFLGFVPYQEIHRHFDGASIFVNTSSNEGFPNTFLQAWSREVPTVSFFDCGARVNGLPVGKIVVSLSEMASSVVALVGDETERLRLGRECEQYVTKVHAPEGVIGMYKEVFQSLLAIGNAA